MATVIVGSGIIGLSTAFYLSQRQPGSTIHLVDSSPQLFASASGYAGGFLAKSDWFYFERCAAALARLSFDEHQALAEREGGRQEWDYTKTVSLRYTRRRGDVSAGGTGAKDRTEEGASLRAAVRSGTREHAPEWLRRVDGDSVRLIDDRDETAILDPLKLCHFLLRRCQQEGVQVHYPATVLSVGVDVRDELSCVCIGYTDSSTETEIPTTRIVLAAGAWTPRVFRELFRSATVSIPVRHLAGHSLVVRKPRMKPQTQTQTQTGQDTDYLVFASFPGGASPELGSRANGVVYVAGVNSASIPLPAVATGARKQEAALLQLEELARGLVRTDGDGDGDGDGDVEVLRTGLCFRPVTDSGAPYVARLTDEQIGVKTRGGAEGGVFVAAGHGPWGILMSLGTGLVMAEMMTGKETSVDVSGLGL